jgi:hypothetical protein
MDKRERLANQLLMRGHASIDELLYASFGEWPPRGLDIVHENPRRVNLTTSLSHFHSTGNHKKQPPWHKKLYEYMTIGGYARLGGERNIFVNRPISLLCGALSVLGHEAAHILQGDHYWRARDIMGKDALSVIYPQEDVVSNITVRRTTDTEFKPGLLRRVFNAVSNASGLGINYLKEGVEIQARLHECLIAGYAHWEKMPQNNTEFLFAMKSVGFRLTPDLRKVMDAHPDREELESAFPRTKSRFSLGYDFVHDIQVVQANLTQKGQKDFWNYTMPRLYADLIEMYGDKHGRERMGLGPNETHAFRSRHENDLKSIAAQKWQYSRGETAGNYAYVHLDRLPPEEEARLLASLDNQYIGTQTRSDTPPARNRRLFVSGELNMKRLEHCLVQAGAKPEIPPPSPPPASVPRNRTASL